MRVRKRASAVAKRDLRSWWPVLAIVAVGIGLQNAVLSGYDAHGHAADHLSSAQVVFVGAALVAIALWSTAAVRRDPVVLGACGVWLISLAGVAVGNLRVVDAIAGADWTDEQAAMLGPPLPGFHSGHALADACSLLAVGAAILLAIVLCWRGFVSRGASIAAVIASALFPRWIVPGAGVVVLVIALCIRHLTDVRTAQSREAVRGSMPTYLRKEC